MCIWTSKTWDWIDSSNEESTDETSISQAEGLDEGVCVNCSLTESLHICVHSVYLLK